MKKISIMVAAFLALLGPTLSSEAVEPVITETYISNAFQCHAVRVAASPSSGWSSESGPWDMPVGSGTTVIMGGAKADGLCIYDISEPGTVFHTKVVVSQNIDPLTTGLEFPNDPEHRLVEKHQWPDGTIGLYYIYCQRTQGDLMGVIFSQDFYDEYHMIDYSLVLSWKYSSHQVSRPSL